MTDNTTRMAEQIIERFQQARREKIAEQARDQKGQPKRRIDDPTNALTDDRGNRKPQRRSLSPRKARQKLDEVIGDAVEPRGGRPYEQRDDDNEDGEVDPRIAEAAERGF